MPHLTEEDLVLHYYGELDEPGAARATAHLHECDACRKAFTKLQRMFAMVDAAPEPALSEGFERIVWARLQPGLDRSRGGGASWFLFSPARLAWRLTCIFSSPGRSRVSARYP